MPAAELMILAGIVVAALAVTAAVAWVARRRLARHRRLAIILSGLSAPLLGIAITAVLNWRDRDVPGDGPAMAMVGTVFLATLGLLATIPLSAFLLRRR